MADNEMQLIEKKMLLMKQLMLGDGEVESGTREMMFKTYSNIGMAYKDKKESKRKEIKNNKEVIEILLDRQVMYNALMILGETKEGRKEAENYIGLRDTMKLIAKPNSSIVNDIKKDIGVGLNDSADGLDLDKLYSVLKGYRELGDIAESNESVKGGINGLEEVEEEKIDLSKEYIYEQYGGQIDTAAEIVIQAYTELFASGYEVVKPYGILCKEGCLRLTGNKLAIETNADLRSMYKVFGQQMGLANKESSSRDITYTMINRGMTYFPRKLLEYAFGRYSGAGDGGHEIYKKHASSTSWSDTATGQMGYANKVIREPLKKQMCEILKKYVEIEQRNNTPIDKIDNEVENILDRVVRAFTTCVLLSAWDNKKSEVKVRVVDGSGNVKKGKREINSQFANILGRGAYKEQIVRETKYVCEFNLVFNEKLCGATPLFAYKALDSLIEKGTTPSWNSIIVGKALDDSIYVGNDGSRGLNFNSTTNCVCHIVAGSRSGKGVMTQSLLSAGISSYIPIVYLDSKPDMAVVFKELAKGRKLFTLTGVYNKDGDPNGVLEPESSSYWDVSKIPEEVRRAIGDSFNNWSPVAYVKAMSLCMWFYSNRGGGLLDIDETGGKNFIYIFDELENVLSTFIVTYNKIIGMYPDITKIKAVESGKGEYTVKEAYAKRVCDWYDTVCAEIKSDAVINMLKDPGSIIIPIYQHIQQDKRANQPLKHSVINSVAHADIYKSLCTLPNTGIIGYKGENGRQYLGETGTKYLTASNRYFAYVPFFPHKEEVSVERPEAEFFKPFLILNNADEKDPNPKSVVNQMKGQLKQNGIDPKAALEEHRLEDGTLEPRIGFEGYLQNMMEASGRGLDEVPDRLAKAYDVFTEIVHKMGYDGDVLDFVYDLRAEYMLTWSQMTRAYTTGKIEGIDEEEEEIEDVEENMEDSIGINEFMDGDILDGYEDDTLGFSEEGDNDGYGDTDFEDSLKEDVKAMEEEKQTKERLYDTAINKWNDKQISNEELVRAILTINDEVASERLGKRGKDTVINTDYTDNAYELNRDNSIDCRGVQQGPMKWFEGLFIKTPNGLSKYGKKLWIGILDGIHISGMRNDNVNKITLVGDNMYVNGKIVNLNGVTGGYEDIRLKYIIDFSEMFKRYKYIKEITLDKDMYNVAIIQMGDNVAEEIYKKEKGLLRIVIKGASGDKVITRDDVNGRENRDYVRKQRMENTFDDKCNQIKKTKYEDNSAGDNIWGMQLAKSSAKRAGVKLRDEQRPRIASAVLYGGVSILAGTIGATAWGISKAFKGVFGGMKK